jgi:hypothetical protein
MKKYLSGMDHLRMLICNIPIELISIYVSSSPKIITRNSNRLKAYPIPDGG